MRPQVTEGGHVFEQGNIHVSLLHSQCLESQSDKSAETLTPSSCRTSFPWLQDSHSELQQPLRPDYGGRSRDPFES